MKLAYITTVQVAGEDAQSLQIMAMSKAFSLSLGMENFLLISPLNSFNNNLSTEFRWKKLSIFKKPRWFRYFLTIIFSLKTINKLKPDIIYSRDIFVVFVYALLGFKVCYEIHKPFETILGDMAFGLIGRKIKIVSISYYLKEVIVKKYSLCDAEVFVAHDGVWLEDFNRLDKNFCRERLISELNLSPNAFLAVYSGNLDVAGKGLDLIISAAKSCVDINFVIVGGDNKYGIKLNNLFFISRIPVDVIPRYLVAADVLLLPFTKELKTYKCHSALKMFEYMASGAAVVASDLGSIKEIFNQDNSFLFNPEYSGDFCRVLNFIKTNPNLSKEKSKRALLEVADYDWLNRVSKILPFLK